MNKIILALGALTILTVIPAQAATTTVTCTFPRYGVVKLEMHLGTRVRNAETYNESHANSRFFMTVNGRRQGALKTPETFISGEYFMSQINTSVWEFNREGEAGARARCRRT